MSDIFKALADPTRREILLMLSQTPTNVNSISEKFKMSRPAISKHIKILTDNELVKIESDAEDGRQRNCYVQLEALAEVEQYLNQLEVFWKSKLDNLGKHLEKKMKSASKK